MASKKQLAWRKKFAKMSKAGKFKKSKSSKGGAKFKDKWTKKKYMIIRFYRDENIPSRVIKKGLTLAQARKHTNDPKTMKKGVWFDGYDEEDDTSFGQDRERPDTGDW